MPSSERFWGVVPAAGVGRRLGGEIPKQYLDLEGHPVIEHSILRLLEHPAIEKVVVALYPGDRWWPTLELANDQRIEQVHGGEERSHSVLNALEYLRVMASDRDWVLVHDAARPCLRRSDLDQLIQTLRDDPVGGLLAMPLHDTVKQADSAGRVEATVPREKLWRALTPQMFRLGSLYSALSDALNRRLRITDDASAMELAGHQPRLVEGRADNIKITLREDLPLAAFYLRQQTKQG